MWHLYLKSCFNQAKGPRPLFEEGRVSETSSMADSEVLMWLYLPTPLQSPQPSSCLHCTLHPRPPHSV